MAPPIDRRDPAARTLSRGRCFLYVLPWASHEDVLKLGFSRDPLQRLQALHPRWFDVFDLERAFLVETEAVRDARALELELRRALVAYNAPVPLTVQRAAAGHTEWYRGAFAQLAEAGRALAARGYVLHDPLRPWLRDALLARGDRLFSWTQAMLGPDELEWPAATTPGQRAVRDMLDACVALDIPLEPVLPEAVLRWHRQLRG